MHLHPPHNPPSSPNLPKTPHPFYRPKNTPHPLCAPPHTLPGPPPISPKTLTPHVPPCTPKIPAPPPAPRPFSTADSSRRPGPRSAPGYSAVTWVPPPPLYSAVAGGRRGAVRSVRLSCPVLSVLPGGAASGERSRGEQAPPPPPQAPAGPGSGKGVPSPGGGGGPVLGV